MALWADLACVGLNADVKLLGDFRQLPAVLDSWAGRPISAPLEHSQLIRDLAGGHRLTENMRSDPGIGCGGRGGGVPHAGAGQGKAEGALPLQARVAGHHAGHQPEASKLLELEVIHMGCYEAGTCGCTATQNSPQSMRVWPGLRLIGAGGKIPKGVFVAVAVEPDGVRLDNGMRLKNQELLRATRPSHAVTYASCQGLTLHNRVRLDLESCHLTVRGRLKGDKLRAAGGLERAARRLQGLQHEVAHLKEHAPLPAHQPHVPGVRKPSSGCRGVCCRGRGLGSSLDCTKSSR